MINYDNILDFYKEKKVFVTGHTGFKGSWMCELLDMAGAEVCGYALEPPTVPSLYNACGLESRIYSVIGDIRDYENLLYTIERFQPEIVIHMAAQPIVRESYKKPIETYETNVMGTVNICEAVRLNKCVKSFVNVTTDKVYLNREWVWGYRENEELNGYDPYSNSKSCSELVTSSYIHSFFDEMSVAVSTVRAGNVIGGGDFASDRIIPDCVRFAIDKNDIVVRNPYSIRPYEHVLEPVHAYLMIAANQYEDKKKYSGSYNVGPNESDCITTGDLTTLFCEKWNKVMGYSIKWVNQFEGGPHEANYLKLDCSKIKSKFGWEPRWNVEMAIKEVINWTKVWMTGNNVKDIHNEMTREIISYFDI